MTVWHGNLVEEAIRSAIDIIDRHYVAAGKHVDDGCGRG